MIFLVMCLANIKSACNVLRFYMSTFPLFICNLFEYFLILIFHLIHLFNNKNALKSCKGLQLLLKPSYSQSIKVQQLQIIPFLTLRNI